MLEAGSVSGKSTINILFKNMCDAGIGALLFLADRLCYCLWRWLSSAGSSKWGLDHTAFTKISASVDGTVGEYSMWFFQFTFAATAATIVSGAVAERTALGAYLVYSVFITAIIYPVVVFGGGQAGSTRLGQPTGLSRACQTLLAQALSIWWEGVLDLLGRSRSARAKAALLTQMPTHSNRTTLPYRLSEPLSSGSDGTVSIVGRVNGHSGESCHHHYYRCWLMLSRWGPHLEGFRRKEDLGCWRRHELYPLALSPLLLAPT